MRQLSNRPLPIPDGHLHPRIGQQFNSSPGFPAPTLNTLLLTTLSVSRSRFFFGFSDTACESVAMGPVTLSYPFNGAVRRLGNPDICGTYEIINNYGWYKDIFSTSGDCVTPAYTVGALKIGRSLNGVCNTTNPCRKCIPSLSSTEYYEQTGVFFGQSRGVVLVDGSDCRAPRTKQPLLSIPLDKCIPFVNGTYARATVVVPNSPSEGLYVDLTTYVSSSCSQLAPSIVKRYQDLSARGCYGNSGTAYFPVANLYNYNHPSPPPLQINTWGWIGIAVGVVVVGNIILRLGRFYFQRPPSFAQSRQDMELRPVADADQQLPAYV
ncbi:hypothetical protein BDR26DRAFT_855910, partial [Obelidium mucronatum]